MGESLAPREQKLQEQVYDLKLELGLKDRKIKLVKHQHKKFVAFCEKFSAYFLTPVVVILGIVFSATLIIGTCNLEINRAEMENEAYRFAEFHGGKFVTEDVEEEEEGDWYIDYQGKRFPIECTTICCDWKEIK